jgi:DNA repair protein RecN (Recombination protein N)
MEASFYLEHLVIQNFATFKNQSISFRMGLNTIIGETGSGKSLVLDALQLILGGRADKKIVRKDTDYALIEARFVCSDLLVKQYLEAEGYPSEANEVVIKRMIFKSGLSKNYIIKLSCTLTLLSTFSRKFIDLVGQFENQKLLTDNYQLYLLDQFTREEVLIVEYQKMIREFKNAKKEFNSLMQSKSHRDQRLDYLNFQLQEIEKLNPSSQDEEDLLKKKNILVNYEKIQKLSFVIDEQFNGSENSIGLNAHLKSIHHILSKNIEIFGETLDVFSELDDKLMNLRLLVDSKLDIEIDPTNLEDVLDRLDMYQRLKKKFGGSTDLIQKSFEDFKLEKEQLESLDLNCDVLEKNISKMENELREKAEKIHSLRIKHSKSLSEVLTQKVRSLKMNGATIKIQIQKLAELGDFGISQVQFLAETNPGEGFFKIKEIASGGELSRILLSIRQILSAHDSISIFLFDEIDTGIGGETGNYIGKALHEVSRNGQVIAITHLPQIAQYADTLVIVHKDIQADNEVSRTESKVRQVVGKLIQKEVKSMTQLIQ